MTGAVMGLLLKAHDEGLIRLRPGGGPGQRRATTPTRSSCAIRRTTGPSSSSPSTRPLMQWFGAAWPSETERAPICEDDALRIETPVGDPCLWCHEPIEEGDRGVTMMELVDPDRAQVQPMHIECNYRQVMGGPAHVNGTCYVPGWHG